MEVGHTTPGAMQRGVAVNAALLEACGPLLAKCNACFASWYTQLHGAGSIRELVRLQSFVTRYRPKLNENALLRHIDGAHVDGSAVLALPTPLAFAHGGLTVWEPHRPPDSSRSSSRSSSGWAPSPPPGGEQVTATTAGTATGTATGTAEEPEAAPEQQGGEGGKDGGKEAGEVAFHYPM